MQRVVQTEVTRIFGDDGEAGDEFVPPQTFVREQIDWMDFAETGLTYKELGKPTLWRVTIFPKQPKRVSKGGIMLPVSAQDAERYLNNIGQVVALGPLAGRSEKFQDPRWWVRLWRRFTWNIKVGDWVIYGRFSGQKTEYKGTLLITCNDDDIIEKIESPEHYRVYA